MKLNKRNTNAKYQTENETNNKTSISECTFIKPLYTCDKCEAVYKQETDLVFHDVRKHGGPGVFYSCDRCHYKAARKDYLKIHQESKDEGIKYACN